MYSETKHVWLFPQVGLKKCNIFGKYTRSLSGGGLNEKLHSNISP